MRHPERLRVVDKSMRFFALSLFCGCLLLTENNGIPIFHLSVAAQENDSDCWDVPEETGKNNGLMELFPQNVSFLSANEIGQPVLLYFFDLSTPENVIWAHAINNRLFLEAAANSCAHIIEADIQLIDGSLVVAHPPDRSSNIRFEELITMVIDNHKGLKLDFKDSEAIPIALAYLRQQHFDLPLILNIGATLGSEGVLFDDAQFSLYWAHFLWPTAILSPSWQLDGSSTMVYIPETVQEIQEVLSVFGDHMPELTFPVNLATIEESQLVLAKLLTLYPNATLTVYDNSRDSSGRETRAKRILASPPFVGRIYREWSE